MRDVVLPLEQVVYARLGVTPEELERLSAESGFSRFPVVDEERRILGYLHVKDALDAAPRDAPFPCRRHAADRPGAGRRPAGRRTDGDAPQPYPSGGGAGRDGTAAGLVTMEDVLRELFGHPSGQAATGD